MIEQARTRNLRTQAAPRRRVTVKFWELAAVVGLSVALLEGFGAYYQLYFVTPTKFMAVEGLLLIVAVGLCPRDVLRSLYLPMPAVWFMAWWFASYQWVVANRHDWIRVTGRDATLVIAVVVLSQLLGHDRFIRVLMNVGYVAIGLIFVTYVISPSRAYDSTGPAPGLHGGFVHKNAMAPCLLLTLILVLAYHRSRRFKVGFVVLVAALLFLGQTTTGLATMLVLIVLGALLSRYNRAVAALGRAAATLLTAGSVLVLLVATEVFAFAVRLSGKDLTFSARTIIWGGVTSAVSKHPWTGYGYSVWTNLWMEPARSINLRNGFVVAESHNGALELLIRLGIIGLVLYLAQLVTTARWGIRRLLRDDTQGKVSLLFCALVIMVGFAESLTVTGVWFGLLVAFGAFGAAADRGDRRTKVRSG